MADALRFDRIDFTYETLDDPLLRSLSFHLSGGWTGVVGANGAGKSTLLRLATGSLTPDAGRIRRPPRALYCPQGTETMPPALGRFLAGLDREAILLRDRLEISGDCQGCWPQLSHGERKRIQIAVALWHQPDLLALDEPTNHLDASAADRIASALCGYRGIGLLVSHDRHLLDDLCRQCLFIDTHGVQVRPGGFTRASRVLAAEAAAEDRRYQIKKRAIHRLKGEVQRRKSKAAAADQARSKKGLAPKDHDARAKKDAARLTGKDKVAGKRQKQLSDRVRQAERELKTLRYQKNAATGIWLPGSVSPKKAILALESGRIALGPDKTLSYPDLAIAPADRIALTGQNGAGKSTFLSHLTGHLAVARDHAVYLPQEIDAATARSALAEARRLPGERLGHLMAIVSRLGSAPQRLLDSRQPSPGETRKLLLALGMTGRPQVIIMDEPTNHMDLGSIECLETALADCPCCLILVSHDRTFLRRLTRRHWTIHPGRGGGNRYFLDETGPQGT